MKWRSSLSTTMGLRGLVFGAALSSGIALALFAASASPAASEGPTKAETVAWLNEHVDWVLFNAEETRGAVTNSYAINVKWKECNAWVMVYHSWSSTESKASVMQVFQGDVALAAMVASDVKPEEWQWAKDASKVPGIRFKPPASAMSCDKEDYCHKDLLLNIPIKPEHLSERERYQKAVRHLITACGGKAEDAF